jgi:hypothetical protein
MLIHVKKYFKINQPALQKDFPGENRQAASFG